MGQSLCFQIRNAYYDAIVCLQVSRESDGNQTPVDISGTTEAVEKCKQLIEELTTGMPAE